MLSEIIPLTAIIPTRNRSFVLRKALISLAQQAYQPERVIIIDASDGDDTRLLIDTFTELSGELLYVKAEVRGAAQQRNQGIALANTDYLFFMDDDVYLEKDCMEKLWVVAIKEDTGGVNALVTNQQFHKPGKISRLLYSMYTDKKTLDDLEGKTIGPVINFLTSTANCNQVIEVDWLNLGATIYKRNVLPSPVFDTHFTGYSFMEDVALSFRVKCNHKLYTVRDARIFHDSQPGDHKSDQMKFHEMQLVNRYYIMTQIQKHTSLKYKWWLFLFEFFNFITSGGFYKLPVIKGKWNGLQLIRKMNVGE